MEDRIPEWYLEEARKKGLDPNSEEGRQYIANLFDEEHDEKEMDEYWEQRMRDENEDCSKHYD